MQLKDFAEMLNKRQYTYPQFYERELQIAKDNGFVIVYGASDDLMELDGAICDEVGVWDGGTVHIQCPYTKAGQVIGGGVVAGNNGQQNVMSITAKWCEDKDENGNTISWTYETTVPHETFDIMEEGEVYCRGIVFCIDKDVPDMKGQLTFDEFMNITEEKPPEHKQERVPMVDPCYYCLCRLCINNAESITITPDELPYDWQPCFFCDICRNFDGESPEDMERTECSGYAIDNYHAEQNRKKLRIVR